ncbi:methyl-accepting chemotaxis protein [Priestia filamentosa]|uniref:methyl-accepting chemotaxis protein n=1 Tax=Priestia filamentosa TaxID=1402861 RepID=UPI00397E3C74
MHEEERLEILRERNKLMEKLGMFSIGLSVLANSIGAKNISFILMIVTVSAIILIGLHLLNRNPKFAKVVPFYASLGVTVIMYIILQKEDHTLTFLMVFYNLIALSFYQDKRPIIFTGAVQILFIIGVYIKDGQKAFPGWGTHEMINMCMYTALCTGLLVFLVGFFKKLQLKAYLSEMEQKKQQEKIKGILDNIKVNIVDDFSVRLKENIKETSLISDEISATFTGVAQQIDQQVKNMEDINKSVISTNKSVIETAKVAENINTLMGKSVATIKEGEEKSKEIDDEINVLEQTVTQVANTMENLIQENEKIEDIIVSISDVAQSTKFLALNTSIEAQRIEGDNKAFNIIADEIMKLANESEIAAQSVSNILHKLKENTEVVGSQIELGKEAVHVSRKNTKQMLEVFEEINSNSNSVMSEIEKNNELMQKVEENSNITEEKSKFVSEVTTGIQAHIEEVLEVTDTQRQKVDDIEDSYGELEYSLIELYESAQQKEEK